MAVWSIPKYSKLPNLRYDPEYYQPSNLELAKRLSATNPVAIETFSDVRDGIHNPPSRVDSGGVTYLQGRCVKDNFFALSTISQISLEEHQNNPRTHIAINDVLVTSTGTIGDAAVVYESILPANTDRDLGIRVHPSFYSLKNHK